VETVREIEEQRQHDDQQDNDSDVHRRRVNQAPSIPCKPSFAQAPPRVLSDDGAMDRTGAERKRTIEERGGNRDALIEGNIVADERQLNPESGAGPDETGSDRVMSERASDITPGAEGVQGHGEGRGAADVLKDGSVPADADLDLPSDAMNDPEQLENGSTKG
jgi:hypothetical protein